MRFCENCGTGHECEVETADRPIPEVEIARINADRDVAVAKLAARSARDELETIEEVAEVQADAEVEAAVAEAEVVAAAIEGGVAPAPEPMIINAPEAVADDVPDDAPPPAEGSAPPPESKHKSIGLGAW